jgi:KUP system potassium uptake protein
MVRLKHLPVVVAVGYFLLSAFIDCLFFGSSIKKVPHGAFVPLAMAVILGCIFLFFHWARGLEDEFDAAHRHRLRDVIRAPLSDNKRHDEEDDELATASSSAGGMGAIEWTRTGGQSTPPTYTRSLELADGSASLARLPVFAFFHTTTSGGLNGAPHAFASFVRSYPSLPQVIIFLNVLFVNVPHAASEDERYLVSRVRSFDGLYLVTLRLGYRDPIDLTRVAGPIRERIVQLEAMDVAPGEVVESEALQVKIAAIDRAIGTVTHIVPHLHVQARDDGTRGVGRWVRKALIETVYRRLKVNFDEWDQFRFGSEEEVLRVGVAAAL